MSLPSGEHGGQARKNALIVSDPRVRASAAIRRAHGRLPLRQVGDSWLASLTGIDQEDGSSERRYQVRLLVNSGVVFLVKS